MKLRNSMIAALAVGLLGTASAETKVAVETAKTAQAEPALDTIVKKHLAALGGEKLLRGGTTVTFTVSGEKLGKKYSKTVHQVRPDKMRVDITSDDGPTSKGFDGKVAWVKKGSAPAEPLSAEDTAAMKAHAQFEEPLLDYAKKGTKLRFVGKSEVHAQPAYDLELTFASGEVEHHFLDAKSFLLVKRTFTAKEKDGSSKVMSVRFGDYKRIQGRMVNQWVEWDGDDGKAYRSVVSKVVYDKPIAAKLFAMPK